jgi:hypothetical protein
MTIRKLIASVFAAAVLVGLPSLPAFSFQNLAADFRVDQG